MKEKPNTPYSGAELRQKMLEGISSLSMSHHYADFYVYNREYIEVVYDAETNPSKPYVLRFDVTPFMEKYSNQILAYYEKNTIEWEKTDNLPYRDAGGTLLDVVHAYFGLPEEVTAVCLVLFSEVFHVDAVRVEIESTDFTPQQLKYIVIFLSLMSLVGCLACFGFLAWLLLTYPSSRISSIVIDVIIGGLGVFFLFCFLWMVWNLLHNEDSE